MLSSHVSGGTNDNRFGLNSQSWTQCPAEGVPGLFRKFIWARILGPAPGMFIAEMFDAPCVHCSSGRFWKLGLCCLGFFQQAVLEVPYSLTLPLELRRAQRSNGVITLSPLRNQCCLPIFCAPYCAVLCNHCSLCYLFVHASLDLSICLCTGVHACVYTCVCR